MTIDYLALAQPGVQGLKPYEPGKPIETLERELGIRDSIKLASNENPLGPSPRALEALRAGLDKIALYPDGAGHALKSAIAERIGCDPACVTLGSGSSEILDLTARAYLGPGLEAVYSEHAFAVYPLVAQAAGAECKVAPANAADDVQPYGHHPDKLLARMSARTRVVFIANPNNPTGTWLNEAALRALIASIPETAVVVVDEAYCEFVEAPDYPDTTRWLEDFPNLIVTRTFSKIHGLAGLRIGYGVSGPEIADVLNRVRQPFNTGSLAQIAALAALRDGTHIRLSRENNTLGLAQLAAGFKAQGLPYLPSVGNFICVDVGRTAAAVYRRMLELGVIVRPIANYGFPNCLRISVGTPAQNDRALAALQQALLA